MTGVEIFVGIYTILGPEKKFGLKKSENCITF